MFPRYLTDVYPADSLPHRRGDVSVSPGRTSSKKTSSPQAWGCFSAAFLSTPISVVFPTGVGMFPERGISAFGISGLPHRRGDVSIIDRVLRILALSSPQAWGCFSLPSESRQSGVVFPTGVGMFPCPRLWALSRDCLPHRRGDVSKFLEAGLVQRKSSPQAWGCFLVGLRPLGLRSVFPTGVGMFPVLLSFSPRSTSLPHRRGDVSKMNRFGDPFISSSPQAWGCFQWIPYPCVLR